MFCVLPLSRDAMIINSDGQLSADLDAEIEDLQVSEIIMYHYYVSEKILKYKFHERYISFTFCCKNEI